MKKIVLTFGLISGATVAILASIHVPLVMSGKLRNGELVGYASMILAYLSVFFGVRAYRENAGGGAITFGRAFKVGILITLITCAVYVIAWEIVYWGFMPDFADKYTVMVLERMREEGATPETLAAEAQKMKRFAELYKNPFFNVGITFLEIFPVGLVMTLISAAILRKRSAAAPGGAPATA